MEAKKCSKCKEIKSFKEFSKNKSTKDGYKYQCKPCIKKHERPIYSPDYTLKKRNVKNVTLYTQYLTIQSIIRIRMALKVNAKRALRNIMMKIENT